MELHFRVVVYDSQAVIFDGIGCFGCQLRGVMCCFHGMALSRRNFIGWRSRVAIDDSESLWSTDWCFCGGGSG